MENSLIDYIWHDFNYIWKRDLEERSMFDLWLHVVDHVSRISGAINDTDQTKVINGLADTSIWVMSFISLYNKHFDLDNDLYSPSKIIFRKYPGKCITCFDHMVVEKLELVKSSSPLEKLNQNKKTFLNDIKKYNTLKISSCECPVRHVGFEKEKSIINLLRSELDNLRLEYANILINNSLHKEKINAIEDMLEKIYINNYHTEPLEKILSNLQKEIGHASRAIVNLYTFDNSKEPYSQKLLLNRVNRLFDEIADIFACIFSFSNKISKTYGIVSDNYRKIISNNNLIYTNETKYYLVNIIWSKYGRTKDGANYVNFICPTCFDAPCKCERDLKINWSFIQFPKLEKNITNNIKNNGIKDLLFIAHSHHDYSWINEVKEQLNKTNFSKKLTIWEDTKINDSEHWYEEIVSALSRTKLIILFLSDNLINSEYVTKNILTTLLSDVNNDETEIFKIYISKPNNKFSIFNNYENILPKSEVLELQSKEKLDRIYRTLLNKISKYIT